MASRKMDSSKSKGKYIPSVHKSKKDTSYTLNFETGPPVVSQPANLAALIAGGPSGPESVPRFDGVGVASVTDNSPAVGGIMTKRHKDIATSEFAEPFTALRQLPVPNELIWDDLCVTYADGPHNFYVVVDDEAGTGIRSNTQQHMNAFYNKFHDKYEHLPFDQIKENGFYVVRREAEVEGVYTVEWERCQILKIISPIKYVNARIVDTGVEIWALPKDFRRIKQTFSELPIQAYQVSLKPFEDAVEISSSECDRFRSRVDGVKFRGVVVGFPFDTGDMKKFQLHLVSINPKTLDDEYLLDEFQ